MTKFQCIYDSKKPKVQFNCDPDQGLTEQNHKDDVDINNILAKYQKTQTLEHRNEYRGEYGFATSQTYEEAMQVVAKATSMFEDLPSHMRQRFNHDPGNFLQFVQNDKNAKEMVKMGLAENYEDLASNTSQVDPTWLKGALSEALQIKPQNEGIDPPKDKSAKAG